MPLGIMAPFMGYQSAALAYNFGLNYEFGKRVIKSMSNEKFNEIANDPILLNELTSRHHDVLLKAFINEVPKVDKIQDLIIKKMVELEFAKIKVMPELIAQIPKGFLEGIFQLGQTGESITTPGETITPPSGTPGGPSPHIPSPPPPIVLNKSFMNANASGRVIRVSHTKTTRFKFEAGFNGTWTQVKASSNRSELINMGNLSYPKYSSKDCTHSIIQCPGSNRYSFNLPGNSPDTYWLNRDKLKTSHNL